MFLNLRWCRRRSRRDSWSGLFRGLYDFTNCRLSNDISENVAEGYDTQQTPLLPSLTFFLLHSGVRQTSLIKKNDSDSHLSLNHH